MMQLNDLLNYVNKVEASDLHIKVGRPPMIRLRGEIHEIPNLPPMTPEISKSLAMELLDDRQKKIFEEKYSVDSAYQTPDGVRFRVNVFTQRTYIGLVLRRVSSKIPTFNSLGLPQVIRSVAHKPQGLFLVTGPTGSGKSTTLAALVNYINRSQRKHIVTIEDPIEYLFHDMVSVINQREVGSDTTAFKEALKNALREDPDIIMVGEMRDQETIQTVITAAETGHLVFSTLHTNNARQTITRIIDTFPEAVRHQVRQQLASTLVGVISQKLVPRTDIEGMIAAVEVMFNTPRIKELIEEGLIDDMYQQMEEGVAYFKMQTMNQSLMALYGNKIIDEETGVANSERPDEFRMLLYKTGLKSYLSRVIIADEEHERISYADYSVIDEYLKLKRDAEEVFQQHKEQLVEQQHKSDRLSTDLAKKDGIIEQLQQQLIKIRQEFQEVKSERDRTIQEQQMQIQNLNSRLAGFQRRG
jgi:twitching motility protein PilT